MFISCPWGLLGCSQMFVLSCVKIVTYFYFHHYKLQYFNIPYFCGQDNANAVSHLWWFSHHSELENPEVAAAVICSPFHETPVGPPLCAPGWRQHLLCPVYIQPWLMAEFLYKHLTQTHKNATCYAKDETNFIKKLNI